MSIIDYFKNKTYIGLDTETTGLNAKVHKLLSIQIGDYDKQFVLRPEELHTIAPLLNDKNKVFIAHNAKFDIRFLMNAGYFIRNVFDTMLAERVLVTGTFKRVGLDVCLKQYLGVTLNKDTRKFLVELGFDHPEFQKYAGDDVKYLPKLRELQMEKLEKNDLIDCINLENRFVPVLAAIEDIGFKLNASKWRKKVLQDKDRVDELQDQLDNMVREFGVVPYRIDATLFGEEKVRLLNWGSVKQVIPIFRNQGINVLKWDKKEKKYKETLNEKFLSPKAHEHPLIPLYIEFQKAKKLLTAYGLNYLEELSLYSDSRLRTVFSQIKNTGRMGSGSGKVNFQNIPTVPHNKTRKIYERECFEPEEGKVLITADYSSQESRLLASISKEPKLLKFYKSGEADLHSYATKLIYSSKFPEMNDMNLKEIKDKFPEERTLTKGFNFALTLAPCCRKAA